VRQLLVLALTLSPAPRRPTEPRTALPPAGAVLDLIYLWRYRGDPDDKIVANLTEYVNNVVKDRLRSNAMRYRKTVAEIVGKVV
jgi:hypothetical protein